MFFRILQQILKQSANYRSNYGQHFRRLASIFSIHRESVNTATQLMIVLVSTASCSDNPKPDVPQRPLRLRMESKTKYKMSFEGMANQYLNALKTRWLELHDTPGVFAYRLNIKEYRKLTGEHNFHVELNAERTMKRRAPQTIPSLNPKFNPEQFNFNKVHDMEVMLTIEHGALNAQLIINNSPLTPYHTLVCPDIKQNLAQRVTKESLNFCVRFMRSIDDENIRMGYNSPGALASVNHLHFHLVHLPETLYIDRVELDEFAGGYIYKLSKKMPTEGLCFEFNIRDKEDVVHEKLSKLHSLTEWMCDNNLPHNLFITPDRRPEKRGNVLVYVFARRKYCVNKNLSAFNVGFCELVGFIPVPDETRLRQLDEMTVIQRITDVTGDAFEPVYKQVNQMFGKKTESSSWQLPFSF